MTKFVYNYKEVEYFSHLVMKQRKVVHVHARVVGFQTEEIQIKDIESEKKANGSQEERGTEEGMASHPMGAGCDVDKDVLRRPR